MPDESTTYGIAAGIAALVVALRDIGGGVIKTLRRKSTEDKQARAEAKEEDAEREQWAAITALRQGQAQHETADARVHTELLTRVGQMEKKQDEMHADVKTLLRRSTGDLPRGR